MKTSHVFPPSSFLPPPYISGSATTMEPVMLVRFVPIAIALLAATVARAQPWQFERLDLPIGGGVTAIASSPDGTLYAGTEHAGIYRSTDNGSTWDQPFDPAASYLPQVAYDDGTIVALLRDNTWIVRNYRPDGLWNRFEFYGFLQARYVWTAAALGDLLFIGTDNGIGVSADTGHTWQPAGEEGYAVRQLAVAWSDLYFVSTSTDAPSIDRIGRSIDSGKSWQVIELSTDLPYPTIAPYGTGLLVHFPGVGLMRWNVGEDTLVAFDTAARGRGAEHVAASHRSGVVSMVAGDSIFLYEPNGALLTSRGLPPELSGATSLHYAADGSMLVGTNGGGIHHSTSDGIEWRRSGFPKGARFRALAVLEGGDLLASIAGQGLARTSDPAAGWEAAGADRADFRLLAVGSDGTWWAVPDRERGVVAHSTNEGASWRYDSTGFNLGANDLRVTRGGSVLMATNGGIIRSADRGQTWELVSRDHNAYLFAEAPDGTIWSAGFDVILSSTDDGATWRLFEPSASGLPTGSTEAMAVTSGGSILVQMVGHRMPLLRSDDGGATWYLATPICQEGAWWFTVSGDRIFALTDCGLMYSDDEGRSWSFGGELPEGLYSSGLFEAGAGNFYLATDQGMYRMSGTSSVGPEFLHRYRLDLR